MRRGRVIDFDDRPARSQRGKGAVQGRCDHGRRELLRCFVKDGGGQPDDMLVVAVLDFSDVVGKDVSGVVRAEVAVRDGVTVIRLVDVLWRQRRRKSQKRSDQQQGSAAGHQASHARIIGETRRRVNRVAVTGRSATGQ